jgi:hypothetical protein
MCKLGVPHEDRHRFDASPDLDLDQYQHGNSDSDHDRLMMQINNTASVRNIISISIYLAVSTKLQLGNSVPSTSLFDFV